MKQEAQKVGVVQTLHQKMIPWWFAPNGIAAYQKKKQALRTSFFKT
jgi:hypothetical protein